MTRYATMEEKITCKYCMVEFTERELTTNKSCPQCLQNPFKVMNLQEIQRAFREPKMQLRFMGTPAESYMVENFDI